MNRLLISDQPPQHPDPKTFPIELAQASNMLPMLRNDHFVHCEINVTGDINNAQLRFCMHLGRVLADEVTLFNRVGCYCCQGHTRQFGQD